MEITYCVRSCINFFREQKYCDVTFRFDSKDGSQSVIGAHKLILSMASEVFETMFYRVSEFGKKSDGEIPVSDFGINSFKLLLE